MKIEIFDSVWDALSETPEAAENMKIRAHLMTFINAWIEKRQLSQTEAAQALGVTQPRISELARGKINLFSIDKLIGMMAHAGLVIKHIEISEPTAA
ncbi:MULTISPECIES: helix-turn-helix domain-containing protein [Pantoea]|uniref:helix-turn-helix domain-containing protein n=1 Tax=Pantoea TaxID=53335 RepID=UPI002579D4AA|nr:MULTISPECIES: XRE family transcriptional regulator [Pantoea]MDU5475746.1 XRE family transcriptional regulator [Pantoea sp.]